jgi:methionyl-tRNA synthetase
LVAYLLSPIIPNLSSHIYQQLGFSLDFNQQGSIHDQAPFLIHHQWGILPLNPDLSKPQPIFAKLEMPLTAGDAPGLEPP